MPTRLIDGDAAWESDKLAGVREEFVPHYFMLLPLALGNGSFQYNPIDIRRRVYAKTMRHVSVADVRSFFVEFARAKLVCFWQTGEGEKDVETTGLLPLGDAHRGKTWGYWVNIERRLPPRNMIDGLKCELGEPVPPRVLAKFLGISLEEALKRLQRVGKMYEDEYRRLKQKSDLRERQRATKSLRPREVGAPDTRSRGG